MSVRLKKKHDAFLRTGPVRSEGNENLHTVGVSRFEARLSDGRRLRRRRWRRRISVSRESLGSVSHSTLIVISGLDPLELQRAVNSRTQNGTRW